MTARFWTALKPQVGLSRLVHIVLTLLLPLLLYVLVRMDFVPLAMAVVGISKWRMFAVRMRYWPAHIRANGVDIIVGLSTVVFMAGTNVINWQLLWVAAYVLWLLFIKPGISTFTVSLQAMIGQTMGLTAMLMAFGDRPLIWLVLIGWMICYTCARHFFISYEEPLGALYAHFWGYFAAAIIWLSGHWLLFYAYGLLAQPTFLLSVTGYGLAVIYYLDHNGRLSTALRRQLVMMMVVVTAIILSFSDWGDRTL